MKNQKGLSMVETMVAGGMLALVSLGAASFIKNNLKQEIGLKFRTDLDVFTEEIRSLLSSEAACFNSFGGMLAQVGTAQNATVLKDGSPPTGAVKYKTGSKYGDVTIDLKTLALKDFVQGDTPSKGVMVLYIYAESVKEAMGPKDLLRRINISVERDATNKITKCMALSKMTDSIWRKSTTVMNDIYYNDGKVGVGTDNPTGPFTVVPNIEINSKPLPGSTPKLHMRVLNAPANNGWGRLVMDTSGNFAFQFLNDVGGGGGNVFHLARKNNEISHMAVGNHAAGKEILLVMEPNDFTDMAYPNDLGLVSRETSNTFSPGIFIGPKKTGSSGGGIRIDYQGQVGVGVKDPSYLLHLAADSAAKPGTGTWTIASDERLKDINGSFKRGLESIVGLNPVYFNYKKNNPLGLPAESDFVGIRAQEVLKKIPEAVKQDEQGYLHINTDAITWATINALKELKEQNTKLKKENSEIKAYLCAKDPSAPICR